MTSPRSFIVQSMVLVSVLCRNVCLEYLLNFLSYTENFQPINFPQVTPRTDQPDLPPYNGFGSEEDSLASCLHLIPKPPRRDFAKFMDQDRYYNHQCTKND